MKIGIITGSNRPGRFNIQPATWITKLASATPEVTANLLDLEEINLPFLDESAPPMMQKYSKEHTKSWSKTISQMDGYIFVTPEYNHSYSAVLKNALDYLLSEWSYKPACFLSYGGSSGGSRAVEHLRTVMAELKIYDLKEQVMIINYWGNLDEKGNYKFDEKLAMAGQRMINELVFWAKVMKDARETRTSV